MELLGDIDKVLKEFFCEIRHFEVPRQAFIPFFVHDEDRCRVVVDETFCLIGVVVDSVKLDVLGLSGDFFE